MSRGILGGISSVLTVDRLVGRSVLAITGAWFVRGGHRAASPNPLWLKVQDLGQVECGCAGNGDISLQLSEPGPFDMAEFGRVDIESWMDPAVAFIVGAVVYEVSRLVYSPHDAEVGILLQTSQGGLAVANLGDELETHSWPNEFWVAEKVVSRK